METPFFSSSCTPDLFLENCVKFCQLTAQSYLLFWAQKENLQGHVHDNLQNRNNLTEWERARMRERERELGEMGWGRGQEDGTDKEIFDADSIGCY